MGGMKKGGKSMKLVKEEGLRRVFGRGVGEGRREEKGKMKGVKKK